MKLALLTASTLGLGLSLASPLMAKADHFYDDRREVRVDRYDRYDRRDFDRDYDRDDRFVHREIVRERVVVPDRVVRDLDFCDLPSRVQHRANDYRHGRRIEFAQEVNDCGRCYFQVGICDREHGDFTLQIESSGHLLNRINR